MEKGGEGEQNTGIWGGGKLAFLDGVARVGLMKKKSMIYNSPINEYLLGAYYAPGLGTRDIAVS